MEEAKLIMKTNMHINAIRLVAIAAVASLMVGCQIPGSSFASEPLQLRFAEATQHSLLAAEKAERSAMPPDAQPMRSAQQETIVLAGHTR